MTWYKRNVAVSMLLILDIALVALIIGVAAFDSGVFVGRDNANSTKQMEQKARAPSAGISPQIALSLSHTSQNVQDQFAIRNGSLRVIRYRTESYARLIKHINKGYQFLHRTGKVDKTQHKPAGSQNAELSEAKEILQYTIQVGAFSSYQNAVDMASSLKADGYTCWMEPESSSDEGQAIYRVFVGKFNARQPGERVAETLVRRLPGITGYIIKE
jgi:cell division septation protein DedD